MSQQLINEVQNKIEAFAEDNIESTRQRWERLNRVLEGKCALQRLDLFKTRTGDRRGELARHIRINNNIDPELTAYVEELKQV